MRFSIGDRARCPHTMHQRKELIRRCGDSPEPLDPFSPPRRRGGQSSLASTMRTPKKSLFEGTGIASPTPQKRRPMTPSSTLRRHSARDYHPYMVLVDSIGAIRVDCFPDGTITADAHYDLTADKGIDVRTEPVQSGTTVGALLDALMANPSGSCALGAVGLVTIRRCHRCHLSVSKLQAWKLDDHYYHRGCVACSVCGENERVTGEELISPIPGVFLHEGACRMCVECNARVEAGEDYVLQGSRLMHKRCTPRCMCCRQPVTGSQVVMTPTNHLIHASCAVCAVCNISLARLMLSKTSRGSGVFFDKKSGRLAHTACCTPCTLCRDFILHTDATSWELPGIGSFHEQCFRCTICASVLGDDHRILEGAKPHCPVCYDNVLGHRMSRIAQELERKVSGGLSKSSMPSSRASSQSQLSSLC